MDKAHTHDPKEFIRGLQQILISDTKKIVFLAGAGTSIATKKGAGTESFVPGVIEMTKRITDSITDSKYKKAVKEVIEELTENKIPAYIEYILSALTQKEQVIGKGQLCGLNKTELQDLKSKIEKEIVQIVSVHNKNLDPQKIIHSDFAEWINQASRKYPVEVFTTNYDYLFEIGFEYHNIPYFDGFVGGFNPFFDSSSVEDIKLLPEWTKLWKLHGSLGWSADEKSKKIIRNSRDDSEIIIFPSILKYDNSKKQPYVSFMDRLGSVIRQGDVVLFICGYSFGDQHINSTIINALSKTRNSSAITLLFDDFDENSEACRIARLQSNLSIYGKRNAVIGGQFGKWRLKGKLTKEDSLNIDKYFNEDATEPDKAWEGTGELTLTDFSNFVAFLSMLHYENYKIGFTSK